MINIHTLQLQCFKWYGWYTYTGAMIAFEAGMLYSVRTDSLMFKSLLMTNNFKPNIHVTCTILATFRMYTQTRLYIQPWDMSVCYKMTMEHEILTIAFLYSFFNGEKLRPIVTDEIKNNLGIKLRPLRPIVTDEIKNNLGIELRPFRPMIVANCYWYNN